MNDFVGKMIFVMHKFLKKPRDIGFEKLHDDTEFADIFGFTRKEMRQLMRLIT